MSNQLTCPGCGNPIDETEKECKYCGAKNPHYVAPAPAAESHHSSSTPASSSKSGGGVNWVVFIILLIVFWPAAIVYLVMKNK